MADPRYRLNVDFDNTITPFQYNGTGSYTFKVPATPNHLGTRYVVFLPAVLYLKDSDKLPAISGYTRIENAIPGAGEFRTIISANYDTLLLKDAIEFPASAAGVTLTMTNFWTIGSTVEPDVSGQIALEVNKVRTELKLLMDPPFIKWEAYRMGFEFNAVSIASNGSGMMIAIRQTPSGSNQMARSTDYGMTWTLVPSPDPEQNSGWADIVYANGMWVAVSFQNHAAGTAVAYSSDGINWSWATTPTPSGRTATNQWWGHLLWVVDKFVCICLRNDSGDGIMFSPDGINWTIGSIPAKTEVYQARPYYDPYYDIITVVRSSTTSMGVVSGKRILYSLDRGATWIETLDSSDANFSALCLIRNADGWFVGGVRANQGSIAFSEDGLNWRMMKSSVTTIPGLPTAIVPYYGTCPKINKEWSIIGLGNGNMLNVLLVTRNVKDYFPSGLHAFMGLNTSDYYYMTSPSRLKVSGGKIFGICTSQLSGIGNEGVYCVADLPDNYTVGLV